MAILKSTFLPLLFIFLWNAGRDEQNIEKGKTQGYNNNGPIELKIGDLTASFIDNTAYGSLHKSGYNGISELRHAKEDSSIFVPSYAGFNLEHVFGGDSLSPLFDPRVNQMKLSKISDSQIELHQKELPLSHVESWTTFQLTDPHFLDITFRYIIHSDAFFKHNYAGLFWASYIHTPSEIGINFLGRNVGEKDYSWIKAISPKHGELSTHKQEDDEFMMTTADNFNVTLASHYSKYEYKNPYYFGLFHNMVLAYFFDVPNDQILRFSQSPTGGGSHNPAWDFYIINPDFKIGKEYSFTVRMMYKPFTNSMDITNEYENWKSSTK